MSEEHFRPASYYESNQAIAVLEALIELKGDLIPLDRTQAKVRNSILMTVGMIFVAPFVKPFSMVTIYYGFKQLREKLLVHADAHAERKEVSKLAKRGVQLLDKLRGRFPADDLIKDIQRKSRNLFNALDLEPDY